MNSNSFLNNIDPNLIEEYYKIYKSNPDELDASWRNFFHGFDLALNQLPTMPGVKTEIVSGEFNVIHLINAYRERGHLFAKTNPVYERKNQSPNLDIEHYGLERTQLTQSFDAAREIGISPSPLKEIIDRLDKTYCGSIGVEFAYIRVPEMREWLTKRMESTLNQPSYNSEVRKKMHQCLLKAVNFEKFIHRKFPGQKRFSLEGTDTLIPALNMLINKSAQMGVKEVVMGMAHRGRLNVLANILKKPIKNIFSEFRGIEYDDDYLLGDVKYHLGHTYVTKIGEKELTLTLAPNPSHLEAVNTVVQGIARAQLQEKYNSDVNKVIPILIHGDAALSGQGIVYESIQMSDLPGYDIGGTIHIVTNNQIGFTTPFTEARSSNYSTDVAKTIQAPIFHVNADDVEAVAYVMELAVEFRMKFNKDVFVDIVGYRRHGHNESDEPRFTQPVLYKKIEKHPDPLAIYTDFLKKNSDISDEHLTQVEKEFDADLEQALAESQEIKKNTISSFLHDDWQHIKRATEDMIFAKANTKVDVKNLDKLVQTISTLPEGRTFSHKTVRLYQERLKNYFEHGKLDWATAELLAFASLVNEGKKVRMSGQDVERGTFSQRHAVVTDEDGNKFTPIKELENGSNFQIFNSLLSEYGVLGFEYGHSISLPDTLTIWEAQFGDFVNGAQIIVDQFVTSGEEKWNIMSGLVMLLPHGFEGQGPEHSSGRMERFLIQCDGQNIQVLNCTTPANHFHALRRQLHRDFRKPAVIFSPKSLLRHPMAVSQVKELTNGEFQEVIDDNFVDAKDVRRVLLTSGKMYYDLLEEQQKGQHKDVAIVRLEQISPIPYEDLGKIKAKYSNAIEWFWVQEEPGNMGAWTYLYRNLKEIPLKLIARTDSSSPATGSTQVHLVQQRKLVEKAFGICKCLKLGNECNMACMEE